MPRILYSEMKKCPQAVVAHNTQVIQIVNQYKKFISECQPPSFRTRTGIRLIGLHIYWDDDGIADIGFHELNEITTQISEEVMSPSCWYQHQDQWMTELMYKGQCLAVLMGAHSRVGHDSTIRSTLRHVLGERQVFRLIFALIKS